MVYRELEQRCREWGVPLYISTIDFTKAFDRIKHILHCGTPLKFYGVKPAYVKLLQRLYSHQEGTVLTDKGSDAFPTKRGTNQGDPLSSLLSNTVLQYSLEEDLKRWQEKRKGIRLSDATEDCLTNLKFADDVCETKFHWHIEQRCLVVGGSVPSSFPLVFGRHFVSSSA